MDLQKIQVEQLNDITLLNDTVMKLVSSVLVLQTNVEMLQQQLQSRTCCCETTCKEYTNTQTSGVFVNDDTKILSVNTVSEKECEPVGINNESLKFSENSRQKVNVQSNGINALSVTPSKMKKKTIAMNKSQKVEKHSRQQTDKINRVEETLKDKVKKEKNDENETTVEGPIIHQDDLHCEELLHMENNVNISTVLKEENLRSIYQYKINEPMLNDSIEWTLRKRNPTVTELLFFSGTFYTANPGYRVQLRAEVDRLHGDVYFSVRVFQGLFDDYLNWPFQQKFCVKLSNKMKGLQKQDWILPSLEGKWKKQINKDSRKKKVNLTEPIGPFNISKFVDSKKVVFDISLLH